MTDTNGTASAPNRATHEDAPFCESTNSDGIRCGLAAGHRGDHGGRELPQVGEFVVWPGKIEDPNNWEDDADYARRQQLGLRPIYYPQPDLVRDHRHPDSRPCPAWCEMGQRGYEHEVTDVTPFNARHAAPNITIAASRYKGYRIDGGVAAAEWIMAMRAAGTSTPLIHVLLSCADYEKNVERMVLSIDDAQDMVTVLQYLIAQADADDALNGADHRERNAFEIGRDYERGLDDDGTHDAG